MTLEIPKQKYSKIFQSLSLRQRADDMSQLVRKKQIFISKKIEELGERWDFEEWRHPDKGGGLSQFIERGKVFEKAGLHTSFIQSSLTEKLQKNLGVVGKRFFACGLSLIFHSHSPEYPQPI